MSLAGRCVCRMDLPHGKRQAIAACLFCQRTRRARKTDGSVDFLL